MYFYPESANGYSACEPRECLSTATLVLYAAMSHCSRIPRRPALCRCHCTTRTLPITCWTLVWLNPSMMLCCSARLPCAHSCVAELSLALRHCLFEGGACILSKCDSVRQPFTAHCCGAPPQRMWSWRKPCRTLAPSATQSSAAPLTHSFLLIVRYHLSLQSPLCPEQTAASHPQASHGACCSGA